MCATRGKVPATLTHFGVSSRHASEGTQFMGGNVSSAVVSIARHNACLTKCISVSEPPVLLGRAEPEVERLRLAR